MRAILGIGNLLFCAIYLWQLVMLPREMDTIMETAKITGAEPSLLIAIAAVLTLLFILPCAGNCAVFFGLVKNRTFSRILVGVNCVAILMHLLENTPFGLLQSLLHAFSAFALATEKRNAESPTPLREAHRPRMMLGIVHLVYIGLHVYYFFTHLGEGSLLHHNIHYTTYIAIFSVSALALFSVFNGENFTIAAACLDTLALIFGASMALLALRRFNLGTPLPPLFLLDVAENILYFLSAIVLLYTKPLTRA